MTARRALAATLAAISLLTGGCGGDDGPADEGSSYADEVEAIMADQVTPAGTAAVDAITNVAQGETDLDAVLGELDGVAADLRAAQGDLDGLEPPAEARVPAEEMAARIGVLADRLDGLTAAQLERDPNVEAENVRTDLERVERRARLIAELD